MTLLAVVATAKEQSALLAAVDATATWIGPYPARRTALADVLVAGVGPAAAAAGAATALALGSYEQCLSLGICGAFRGTAEIGDTVVATELVAADLGADSPEGFLGSGSMGWADDVAPVDPALLGAVVARLGSPVTGPVLTVSTVTGTRARADLLAQRYGAVAEAMEGWGVLTAALPLGVPVLEVRTVSNLIGDRNPAAWDTKAALASLEKVGSALLETAWL